jgi:signal transduction histidine kinase
MFEFLKKHKPIFIGFLITASLFGYLDYLKIIIIPKEAFLEVRFVFVFWWGLATLIVYNLDYLKTTKVVLLKIVALIAFLTVILIIDSYFKIPDNPLSILLIISFWLGVLYLLVPAFFKKYQLYIFSTYLLCWSYFTYVRLASQTFEVYLEQGKELAFTFMAVPIPIMLSLWIYEQWKWLRDLQMQKTAAELAMLKTQVNPHFFFNTLNNLYSLTVQNSNKAPDVILKLSDMMRYTIYEGKKEEVSLQSEIEYLENYIDLHKIRYHKSVDIQFEHSIEENAQIAPLLFIILLENAFKHGVDTLTEAAYIKMNLSSNDNKIHFTIENNFDPNEINEKKGIGLENLKRRLSLTYPKKHQFTISQKENTYKIDLKITV